MTQRSTLQTAILRAVSGQDATEEESRKVATAIMEGEATEAQIAALLVALRMKGESVDEISGFVGAMRTKARRVPGSGDRRVDTCGTGGDGRGTFNISTVCALVAAACGCEVAKHGNRSVSSRCGSSEVLEALGINAAMDPDEAKRHLDCHGLCFLFAPNYHQATRHAVGPRREIGVRSIFNIVGPLTNPAGARRQLLGVFKADLTEPLAHVLAKHGSIHCMVVHGLDGLDEITLDGPTRVSELKDGQVRSYLLDPRELGFERRDLDGVRGGDPETNARLAVQVLEGRPGAPREIVLLNAGAVNYVGGVASSLEEGVRRAAESLDSGQALALLKELRDA